MLFPMMMLWTAFLVLVGRGMVEAIPVALKLQAGAMLPTLYDDQLLRILLPLVVIWLAGLAYMLRWAVNFIRGGI